MKKIVHIITVLLVFSVVMGGYASCSEENDCSLTGRPLMYCTFYTIEPDTRTVRMDTLDSLTITAYGTDSIILNNEKDVHSLMLPLRYTLDSTVFIFHYNPEGTPSRTDTLVISQQNTAYFQSMDCGYMMEQEIVGTRLGYSRRSSLQLDYIDSIYIRNNEANTNEIENLQIFLRYRDRIPTVE